ncbi:MAG: RDD family protein [Acidobacteria bacterium]|nr:RDD family protein [Acidobacteriota bacterium]
MADWYYALEGRQLGPVTDAEIQKFAGEGVVTASTLVWKSGMAQWQPYESVRASTEGAVPPIDPAIATTAEACSQCGALFSLDNLISYQGLFVCAACKPLFFQKVREGATPKGWLDYAGVGMRFLAVMIDGIIITIPFVILMTVGIAAAAPSEGGPLGPFLVLLLELAILVGWGAYEIWFIGRFGATPGKMICKIKVVTPEGGAISYGRSTARFFAKQLSGMICYIGYIMALFDKDRQTLHDRICNTRVIRA